MMGYKYMAETGNFEFLNRWGGFILPFVLLELVLKGFALWRSARNGQSTWFMFLLIINSMGILPGIYLLLNKEKPLPKKK